MHCKSLWIKAEFKRRKIKCTITFHKDSHFINKNLKMQDIPNHHVRPGSLRQYTDNYYT